MIWWILFAIVAIVLFAPALLADRSPIPETSGQVFKVTTPAELDSVLKNNTNVVVDFYADWCPPCRMIAPIFSGLADENSVKGQLAFAKVNVDHVNDVAGRYGVSAMPTFVIFKDGKPAALAVPGIKKGQSVVMADDGKVERLRGADPVSLKAVVAALRANVKD